MTRLAAYVFVMLISASASAVSVESWPEVEKSDGFVRNVPGTSAFALKVDSRLLSLLPARFRLAIDRRAQVLADDLTEKIFGSPSARQSLCVLGALDRADFELFLGVSPGSAARLKKVCASLKYPAHSLHMLRMMRASFYGQTVQPKKVYVFAATQNELPAIEGFTQKNGLTVVILNEKEMTEAHMIRVLAHELAITYDQVGGLVSEFPTESWELGLEAIYPEASKNEPVFETPEDLPGLRCALRDPAVRYAAATERAIRFEDRVITELGLAGGSPALASAGSCARAIAERAVQIAAIQQAISWETDLGTYTPCGVGVLNDANRRETLVNRIRLVASTVLVKRRDGARVPLCDLLIQPHVGSRRPENLRHSGPRPRIGGW